MGVLTKFIAMVGVFLILLTSCDRSSTMRNSNSDDFGDVIASIEDMPAEEISTQEEAGLLFMREEEKLARDVYIVLFAKWDARVFNNISKSETKHTEAIKAFLDKYEIKDPVINDEIGLFQNDILKNLYLTLTEMGDSSLVDALKVGGAIEEIDILDLQRELNDVVDNEDIAFVYENLLRGSRNHLRSFVKNLNNNGIEYAPQYLSNEAYLEIISSSNEKGK